MWWSCGTVLPKCYRFVNAEVLPLPDNFTTTF
jgi:hypothetical protein